MAIGLLHPGEMGSAVGEDLLAAGRHVLWASTGRSAETAARAEQAGLEDAGTVEELVRRSADLTAPLLEGNRAAWKVKTGLRRYIASGLASLALSGTYLDNFTVQFLLRATQALQQTTLVTARLDPLLGLVGASQPAQRIGRESPQLGFATPGFDIVFDFTKPQDTVVEYRQCARRIPAAQKISQFPRASGE